MPTTLWFYFEESSCQYRWAVEDLIARELLYDLNMPETGTSIVKPTPFEAVFFLTMELPISGMDQLLMRLLRLPEVIRVTAQLGELRFFTVGVFPCRASVQAVYCQVCPIFQLACMGTEKVQQSMYDRRTRVHDKFNIAAGQRQSTAKGGRQGRN